MARKHKCPPTGAPDWVVTYGDMMSLLLCFFVILVSLSETKKDQRFYDAMESIRAAFGVEGSMGIIPVKGDAKSSLIELLRQAAISDATKNEGDSEDEGIDGRTLRVTSVREGICVQVGGRVTFDRFQATVKPEAGELLTRLASAIEGHNTVIKVIGHATLETLPPESPYVDALELSVARARAVRDILVGLNIRPERIRIIGAGAFEPLVAQAYTEERRALNRRVEVIVTEAIVDDYAGQVLSTVVKDPLHGG